jgi:hypothetical protein
VRCALFVAAVSVGGCSYPLGSLLDKDDKADSIGMRTPLVPGKGALPSDADLAYASAAAADVLANGGKDTSAPWENPSTGARGTVTPIAAAYAQDGSQCREFLASYVVEKNEAWLQGEACRIHQGRWVVRSLKPWRRAKDPAIEPVQTAAVPTDS